MTLIDCQTKKQNVMKIKNVLVSLTLVIGLGLAGLSSSNAQESLPPNEATCYSVYVPNSGSFTIYRCGTCETLLNIGQVESPGICLFPPIE
jgi:hypothetical protein